MTMQHKPISVLIVDDHPMVIEGLKTLLSDDERVHVKTFFTNWKDTLAFLEKETVDELVNAITQAHNGNFYFGSEVQKILADSVSNDNKDLPKLTRREKHILSLIAEGKTTNSIAEELFISPLTVETHRRNLMQKLEVSNAASLIKIAVEQKLI